MKDQFLIGNSNTKVLVYILEYTNWLLRLLMSFTHYHLY